jgi:hypothetical protein
VGVEEMVDVTVDLERVATIAARECVRQQVALDRLMMLLDAYGYALNADAAGLPRTDLYLFKEMARRVDPEFTSAWRQVPVTFRDGGEAAHHSTVSGVIVRMWAALDESTDPDEFVKAFLDVHPFKDGNGRTAWVLYNWLRGTLDAPDPLPDYYGPRQAPE